MRKGFIIFLACLGLIISNGAYASQLNINFSLDSLNQEEDGYHYSYAGLKTFNVNENISLPIKTIYLSGLNSDTEIRIIVNPEDRYLLATIPDEISAFNDAVTGSDNPLMIPPTHNLVELLSNDLIVQSISTEEGFYRSVSFLPIVIDSDNNIIFNTKVTIETDEICKAHDECDMTSTLRECVLSNVPLQIEKFTSSYGLPFGSEYVIITVPELVGIFKTLARFKNETGISTDIAIIDSIYAHYPGLDQPEQVRNYLKDFYRAGGKYVLMGGDDQLLPVRYLYYYNTNSAPSSSYYLMPSDLYYADLTGDWDVDGDGIWGEPTHDNPDIVPEIKVARLPVKTDQAADNYISKLIKYQTNPGNGDFDYLTKVLFFSSDQMRDYPATGQHGYIAAELPTDIEADTSVTIELAFGDDPSPTNQNGVHDIEKISEGFGLIHILAHGRTDGFVVRSANYNEWPKSYILAPPATGSHGSITNLEPNGKVSLYYSLSCRVGGYDLDNNDGESSDHSFVERIISAEDCGAVGMIAYSRWGWVYSSYYLEAAFTKYLYTEAEGSPIDAMYYSWLDYYYYRDLIYGQNFFGDPTLRIYRQLPSLLKIETSQSLEGYRVVSTSDNGIVPNTNIILSQDGEILETGTTDVSGQYILTTELELGTEYCISGVLDGHTTAREFYTPSIVTESDTEITDQLPEDFLLEQNYPNPFNPNTVIEYSLSKRTDITLEIFNCLGQLIKSYSGNNQSAGNYNIVWDGTDNGGQEMPSGMYFYVLEAEEFRESRKMVLLK